MEHKHTAYASVQYQPHHLDFYFKYFGKTRHNEEQEKCSVWYYPSACHMLSDVTSHKPLFSVAAIFPVSLVALHKQAFHQVTHGK